MLSAAVLCMKLPWTISVTRAQFLSTPGFRLTFQARQALRWHLLGLQTRSSAQAREAPPASSGTGSTSNKRGGKALGGGRGPGRGRSGGRQSGGGGQGRGRGRGRGRSAGQQHQARNGAPGAPPGPLSALHNDIADFAWRCTPAFDDVALVAISGRAVEDAWARSRRVERGTQCEAAQDLIVTEAFGSQPAGLALPGGDVDLTFELVRPSQKHLHSPYARERFRWCCALVCTEATAAHMLSAAMLGCSARSVPA
jgi:hypothetical protein